MLDSQPRGSFDSGIEAEAGGHLIGSQARRDPAQSAVREMTRVLDVGPVMASDVFRADTRLTKRWSHGELHDALDPVPEHVVMTYYGAAQKLEWYEGRKRVSSTTRSGTITLIPSGHHAKWDIGGPLSVSHAYIPADRLQACAAEIGGGRPIELVDRITVEDPTGSRLLELLAHEAAAEEPSSRLFVEQAVDLLCVHLARVHSTLAKPKAAEQRRGLPEFQVRRVTTYMQEHLAEEVGLDELAGLAGLSRFHFCTAFKQATGQSPHERLTALRISRARELLADRSLSITDIALSVGYQGSSSFAATFRRVEGITASEFRRSL